MLSLFSDSLRFRCPHYLTLEFLLFACFPGNFFFPPLDLDAGDIVLDVVAVTAITAAFVAATAAAADCLLAFDPLLDDETNPRHFSKCNASRLEARCLLQLSLGQGMVNFGSLPGMRP
jgi:hypothetical protein